jgi:Flp pilus assembly protein TadG
MIRRTGRRGASAIEFALLFPVFVWLLTGVVDYGFYMAVRAAADSAVYQGARTGALTLVKNDPVTVAKNTVKSRMSSSGLGVATPTVTASIGGTAPDKYLTVTATVAVPARVGLVPVPSVISSSLVMRIEDQ